MEWNEKSERDLPLISVSKFDDMLYKLLSSINIASFDIPQSSRSLDN